MANAVFSTAWSSPRAVYPATPIVLPLLSIIIVVVTTLNPHTARACSYIAPPRFPPPRVYHAHVAR